MWVVPKNLQASSGLLAGLETIKDSAELSQTCAASLFARGKDTPSATWSRRWKRVGWHQRLSGRIAEPSPSNRSLVEGWISSLLPIRAKENLLPATSSAPKILDSYGRIVETSLQQLDLFGAFSKTSEGTSTPQWSKSSATWQIFSTQLSQEYLARKSAAAHTHGRGFLSLRGTGWPTPDASVMQDGETPDTWIARRDILKKKGTNGNGCGTPLTMASMLWPTPTTRDYKGANSQDSQERRKVGREAAGEQLGNFVVHNFQTPLPAPMTPMGGIECFYLPHTSHLPSDGRKLNVFFVEWLMDWPMNHTCTNCGACSAKIALIASGCLETESIPSPQPSHL